MPISMKATVVIIGETAGGVAAAITLARQGLSTVLVTYDDHLAPVLCSLGAIETHYTGRRSPLVEEIKERIRSYYRLTYGEESPQYLECTRLDPTNPMITFEPRVLETIILELVAAEPNINVLNRCYPIAVEMAKDRLNAVVLQSFDDDERYYIEGETFIDATYQGDLAATAGVTYRIGREARQDYDEPHAGKVFTRWVQGQFPVEAARGKLNILPKWTTLGLMSGSTGEGDDNIQAYSYRLCICSDPDNRRLPEKPDGYNREDYLGIVEPPEVTEQKQYALHHRFLTDTLPEMIAKDHLFHGHALPNHKRSWNATNFPGAGKAYPEASWSQRNVIAKQHADHALGIMYFLQNDEAVPADIRMMAREWGLALDEFVDNENIPYQMYIREARRIYGRYTYSGQDCMQAPGLKRAPINADSVAITEFPLDSLACTTERQPGSLNDGQLFLMEISRPGQVPYRVMLPEQFENLLVPVTASVTHIAWGTIRQTPTLIQMCEAAGFAAVLAHQHSISPSKLAIDLLQRTLVKNGLMISFFNDFDMGTGTPWVAAVQYLGTKGLFNAYDARPFDYLTYRTGAIWIETIRRLLGGTLDATRQARTLPDPATDQADKEALTAKGFVAMLLQQAKLSQELQIDLTEYDLSANAPITRGDACRLLYNILQSKAKTLP